MHNDPSASPRPRSFKLLRGGKTMNLLFYGDSITAGANCTQHIGINTPNASYGKILHAMLCERYGEQITFTNTAVGSKETT